MSKAAPPLQILAPPTLLPPLQARVGDSGLLSWQPLSPEAAPTLNPDHPVILINGALDDLQRLQRPGLTIIDVVAYGDPVQAQRYGWMIGAGGDAHSLTDATPLLDLLSPPFRHAWLQLGSTGSAAFVASLLQHWQAQTLSILDWLGGTPQAQWTYDPAAWQRITQTTLNRAQQDARRYLAMTTNYPFEPIRGTPAALQQFLPGQLLQERTPPAILLAQLLLGIPAVPISTS